MLESERDAIAIMYEAAQQELEQQKELSQKQQVPLPLSSRGRSKNMAVTSIELMPTWRLSGRSVLHTWNSTRLARRMPNNAGNTNFCTVR